MDKAEPTHLIGLDKDELQAHIVALGFEPYRAKQLWHWMYVKGHTDFAGMHNFSKDAREKLAAHFTLARPAITTQQQSVDGTRKWLLGMDDKNQIECVHIPEVGGGHGALCLSSQVGCTLTCKFCHTGTQRLVRNLTAGEIVAQVLLARDEVGDWQAKSQDRQITNLVFMGMGEPLFNYENVATAVKIINDADGIAISRRRITLSTSGVVPFIERCGAELGVNLAISLHAVTDELRDKIVPINRKYPIKELLEACKNYPAASNSRRITFEYVMLKGVNDSDADARALIKMLRGVHAKINLIPFNPWPNAPFECSDHERIETFGLMLNEAGYVSPIRNPRGRDIMAACGQLKSDSMKLSAVERAAIAQLQLEKEQAVGL